ncbi:dihydrofolate reductase family protein [Cohnella sp. WQ 127256]|uniref:dihydrofolate reductase family protein n=1 Tax=Cohnella sp. WQ 127256 TaxID=2938790 RepID=UPI003557CB24
MHWGDYGDTISLLSGDLKPCITELKREIEGNIIVPGSADLVQSLLNADLIDEFSMIIHPVILGSGEFARFPAFGQKPMY